MSRIGIEREGLNQLITNYNGVVLCKGACYLWKNIIIFIEKQFVNHCIIEAVEKKDYEMLEKLNDAIDMFMK